LSVLAAGIGGAGLVLATPGSALAATPATVKLTNSAASGSGTSYDGGTGNASNLRIVREGGKIAVTDVVPVTPAPAAYRSRRRGRCASRPSSAREVRQVSIRLGDLGDRVSVEGRFFGNVFGDAGNDFMYAGQKDCCGDSQLIYNGGPDFDTVSYERAVTAVSVTKDDINNDGLISSFGTTSGDNVRDDVEQVFGSAFADKLTGEIVQGLQHDRDGERPRRCEVGRVGALEPYAEIVLFRGRAGFDDRTGVAVETPDPGLRVRPRDSQGRPAVSAAEVGEPATFSQPLGGRAQCRQPRGRTAGRCRPPPRAGRASSRRGGGGSRRGPGGRPGRCRTVRVRRCRRPAPAAPASLWWIRWPWSWRLPPVVVGYGVHRLRRKVPPSDVRPDLPPSPPTAV
jgi:hypothetical protein